MQGPIIGTLHNENKSMRYQLYILLNIVYYWCASQSCAIYLLKVDLIYVGVDSLCWGRFNNTLRDMILSSNTIPLIACLDLDLPFPAIISLLF